MPFHNSSELALPTLSKNLQLQFLSSARWAVCNWGPGVPSQIPWLWECARLLEKVMIVFLFSSAPKSYIHLCLNKRMVEVRVVVISGGGGTGIDQKGAH